jgi:aminopeptidase-like protein
MKLCSDLFPFNRSLTGLGNLQTLEYISKFLPDLEFKYFPTGFQAYDWTVPEEWIVREAYIAELDGTRIIDFRDNNLHLVGYSTSINQVMSYDELRNHIFIHENLEDAIPYRTAYYERAFGFCLSAAQLKLLRPDRKYRIFIDTELVSGELISGELIIKGSTNKEILLSSYICHPSMANNELSGPVVLTALASWIAQLPSRHFTYRVTFHPETIGALCYIKKHETELKQNVIAAWNFTCMGGPGNFRFLKSSYGSSVADKISTQLLLENNEKFSLKSFLTRGSDERQFSSPNIGIPMVSIMRSAYGEYDYYHTSKDDLDFITEESLQKSLELMKQIIRRMEDTKFYRSTIKGEPFLHKYGLYATLHGGPKTIGSREILNVIHFCDARNSISEIANLASLSEAKTQQIIDLLLNLGLIE